MSVNPSDEELANKVYETSRAYSRAVAEARQAGLQVRDSFKILKGCGSEETPILCVIVSRVTNFKPEGNKQ